MFQGLFQPMHLVIILIIALVIFGPGKIGDLGGSLGKAIRGFKKAMDEPEKKLEYQSGDQNTGRKEDRSTPS